MCINYDGNAFDTALKNGDLRKFVSYVHPLPTDRVSITTLQTATYNEEIGHTTCTWKI
jgi:hypothetical protein